MWFIILIIVVAVIGLGVANFLNRKNIQRIKDLEKRVAKELSKRTDLSFEMQLEKTNFNKTEKKGALFLIGQISKILSVSPGKLRLDDRVGDYFFCTFNEPEINLHEFKIEANFDAIHMTLEHKSSSRKWNKYRKINPKFCDEDEALLVITYMTLLELLQTVIPLLKDKYLR